jgi:peptidoglycan hydrolase-like protein with peptidoglycan-binding domain
VRKPFRYASAGLAAAALVAGLGATSASAAVSPNASSPQCHFSSAQPLLGLGSVGDAVYQAQCEVNFAWLNQFHQGGLVLDGQFGPATRAAVRNFQSCAHLAVDGLIGQNTWTALNKWTPLGGLPPSTC